MTRIEPPSPTQPIGLTVYDLPSPVDAAIQDSSRTRAGRLRMLMVFAVCAAPMLLSYFFYYVIRPQNISAFGELIEPQRDLPSIMVKQLDGRPINLTTLRGQWLFIATASGKCDPDCEKLLYIQRQLHKGLGKQQDKLERVWLVSDDASVSPNLVEALQGATILRINPKDLEQWLYSSQGHAINAHLYLIDPMGHWMMRFPPNIETAENSSKIKRDLERLLRAATSWDQPGR